MDTVSFQMFLAKWWEKSYPVFGVNKLGDLLLFDFHLFKDVVLTFNSFRELGRVAIIFQLEAKFLGSSRYGHASAVEAEGEEYIIS